MATTDQIAEWKHAYQVLDAPLYSSALAIKQCYRKLVKRWHPDRYASGTQEYAEATQMTRTINEAYSAIKDAPLRYYIDAFPTSYVEKRQAAGAPPVGRSSTDDVFPKVDWVEYSIRFVCGAILGALLSVRWFLIYSSNAPSAISEMGIVMLVFGLAAARYGDRFWHSFFRKWWMWW
ncbi:MAG TPA: J domain-containing protein [Candidatus Acidoferrales bacterium]|nr:J domain-containing protein [Candidatus Acidoferrales bacterium]